MPSELELRNDLTLTRDAFLGFDDVPFDLSQMFLPDCAVHRASAISPFEEELRPSIRYGRISP